MFRFSSYLSKVFRRCTTGANGIHTRSNRQTHGVSTNKVTASIKCRFIRRPPLPMRTRQGVIPLEG